MSDGILTRAVVFVAIVGVIVGVSFGAGAFSNPSQPTVTETEGPQYDTAELQVDRVPSEGTVEPDPGTDADGVLLVDTAHGNGFERADIEPLLAGATEAGFEVRFLEPGQDLTEQLDEASAFLVVDPHDEYDTEEVDTVEEFVDGGGRLVIAGEPNRARLEQAGLGFRLVTVESDLTQLGSRFGISFGTDNLYNLEENDGNFRNVLATPADGASLGGVERVALDTPTHIETDEGEAVLTATEGTQRSSTRVEDEYAVAVRDGGVFAVGDTSFFGGERHNVADNEVLTAELIGFLAEGSSPDLGEDTGADDGSDTIGGGGGESDGNATVGGT